MEKYYLRIKERRKELGMSQAELARRIGYSSQTTITKIEKGEIELTQQRIVQFADALDTSVEWLLGLDELDKKQEATHLLNRLSSDELQTVLTLLRQMTAGRE